MLSSTVSVSWLVWMVPVASRKWRQRLLGRGGEVVGDQEGGLFSSDVAHGELADWAIDALDLDQLVVDLRCAVTASPLDTDRFPCLLGELGETCHELGATLAQRQPADGAFAQLAEHLVGRELGVEHEQSGVLAGDVLPVVGEGDYLSGLLGLGEVGVCVDHL